MNDILTFKLRSLLQKLMPRPSPLHQQAVALMMRWQQSLLNEMVLKVNCKDMYTDHDWVIQAIINRKPDCSTLIYGEFTNYLLIAGETCVTQSPRDVLEKVSYSSNLRAAS